ncbi:MAG: dihydroorotase [Betaproteobacteria bacterium]|nr:dihydroorotase [Betaproteobacteria bacterium]
MTQVTIIRPDDWHLHLRDGIHLRAVLPDTARRFARAIVMPNLQPPVTTADKALGYRARILAALPEGMKFAPLMTLYLTDRTTGDEIRRARQSGVVHAVKYYPAGATTNSDSGVTALTRCEDALAAMAECDLPLLVHGEVTFPDVDIFDREKVFIDRILVPLLSKFSRLRVVFEHITTRDAVRFVLGAPPRVAATITAHHLLLNRNALLAGGIHPHHYCLPILKREEDRQALIGAAVSGNSKFFLGTDSAPHARNTKEAACGCAGIYSAHAGIELYAEIFEAANALDRLEGFASIHGPDFYGLPRNHDQITLVKVAWSVPQELPFHDDTLVPFRAGGTVSWRIL